MLLASSSPAYPIIAFEKGLDRLEYDLDYERLVPVALSGSNVETPTS